MSKRTGNIVTLADILDEVDPDVCRLTFLLQGIDTAQTFDLDVVTAQSMDNPVYYVQYAHARIASIARQAAARGVVRLPLPDVNLALLVHERELELLRGLAALPRRGGGGGRAARAAPGRHLGARLRGPVPRLLPRLPRDLRRRRAHPGPAVARRGEPDRAGQRARHPRRGGTRGDDPPRRRRRRRTDDRTADGRRVRPTRWCRPASAALDLDALAAEFGTPLFVYDEDALRATMPRVRRRVRGRRGDLRGQGVPLHGDGPARRRGGPAPRRRDRRRAARRAARRLPRGADRVPRQQQVATPSCAPRLRAGVGRIVVDSHDELDRLER